MLCCPQSAFAARFRTPLSSSGDSTLASAALPAWRRVCDNLFVFVVGRLVGVGEPVAFFADANVFGGGDVPGL
jgi:hypothetical protein